MRALTAYDKTTPTYLFNITDSAQSGVDVANMKAMMCLLITTVEGSQRRRYIAPDINELNEFSYISDPADPLKNEIWAHPSYSRNLGNGMFAITVPFWRFGEKISTAEYQVFLYSDSRITADVNAVDETTGDPEFTPGLIMHHNILIDSGTFTMVSTLFPLTRNAFEIYIKQYTGLESDDIQKIAAWNFVRESPKDFGETKDDTEISYLIALLSLPEFADYEDEKTSEVLKAKTSLELHDIFDDILDRMTILLDSDSVKHQAV